MESNLCRYQIVHIPDKQPYPLHQQPTVNAIASVIDSKHANQIIKHLNKIEPLENLRHVKRVQKKILEAGQIQLSAILCQAFESDNQLDSVPPHLQELIRSYHLSPFITKVCKYAATSKEEWQEQCKIWPTSYHPRTYREDSQLVFKFMQSAVELATSEDGLVVNAAVIVDPSAKQVITSACDEVFVWNTCKDNCSTDSCCLKRPEFFSFHPISNKVASSGPLHLNAPSNQLKQPHTSVACLNPWRWAEQQSLKESLYYWHPLRHAAIIAIESSAARDRCLFPCLGNVEENYLELDQKSSWTGSPAKRQRTIPEDVEDDETLNAFSQSSNQVLARPYLCTGYDIFLVWEPCPM